MSTINSTENHVPWNKGKLVGQKAPLKPPQVWAIRGRLQIANSMRDLALFNLAVKGKLRGGYLLRIKAGQQSREFV